MTVHGTTTDRYAGVHAAFAGNLATGADTGAAFCATVDGETVADLWGGFADEAGTRPWHRDTIVNVYSVTKTVVALTALLVADRGDLDFAAPVARYWPEFAAAGKADVTVAQLMSHSSGLAGWRAPITRDDLYDWAKVTALLAAQEPFWKPGTASGYHAMTQGYLIGEVIRRITGRSLGTVFRDELATPLGADFHIGLPATEDHRVADLIPPAEPPFDPATATALQHNVATNPELDVADTRSRAWRGAEIPACGGTGNARAVAEILAVLANDGASGNRQLLSPAGCRKVLEPQTDGRDLVLGMQIRFGLGFALGGGLMPNPNTVYWGGYGGSFALVDLDARTTLAYTMNRMSGGVSGDLRAIALAMAFWDTPTG
ncbi:serine hydrolase domain-containing protein [Jidongwangia harbinensis]|uniref:serine hydrolase domain-containing protein n=1 Tax=Jidongwangia harbinensis TaxID=2878561 RepID=UPI001CD99181|nr:serine hydrolase domain-containing protein [Jidongwangia harbinensis]MCA2217724.1 beta-lactamase family protein [Jidongwangia harbinensis]